MNTLVVLTQSEEFALQFCSRVGITTLSLQLTRQIIETFFCLALLSSFSSYFTRLFVCPVRDSRLVQLSLCLLRTFHAFGSFNPSVAGAASPTSALL